MAVATLLLALLMAVPATAAAEGPEFGRCIEEKKGNFDDAACTTASAKPGKGSFEWVPGVVKPQFTQMMPSEAAMDLDAGPRNLLTVICWGERDSGTFTDPFPLTLITATPGTVRWSFDGWTTVNNSEMRDSGLGCWFADLPSAQLASGAKIVFTFRWPEKWEGRNFIVGITEQT